MLDSTTLVFVHYWIIHKLCVDDNGQTHDDSIHRASIASCGKKRTGRRKCQSKHDKLPPPPPAKKGLGLGYMLLNTVLALYNIALA